MLPCKDIVHTARQARHSYTMPITTKMSGDIIFIDITITVLSIVVCKLRLLLLSKIHLTTQQTSAV